MQRNDGSAATLFCTRRDVTPQATLAAGDHSQTSEEKRWTSNLRPEQKQCDYISAHCSRIFGRVLFYLQVPKLLPFVVLMRVTCKWKWVWSILTGKNWNTRRKTSPSAILSTTNETRIGPGSNQLSAIRDGSITASATAWPSIKRRF
jgi:hypothetical protein